MSGLNKTLLTVSMHPEKPDLNTCEKNNWGNCSGQIQIHIESRLEVLKEMDLTNYLTGRG